MQLRGRSQRGGVVALTVLASLAVAAILAAPVSATVPVITVPGNITAEATSASGATVTFPAASSDDPLAPATCDHSSGETFPIGTTTVTCSATNAGGEKGSASFLITVQDTTKPNVSVPGDITQEASSSSGATVSFSASASDSVDGSVATSCSPASGSTFGFGSTPVTCSATDAHGNTGNATFHVLVGDTTKPVVTAPADINDTTTVNAGKVENFSASASDNIDGSLPASCSPSSGSTFPIGQTTVNCSATDAHGNTGTASFKVTISLVDTTPPVVTAPGDINQTTTVSSGKVVNFSASANDNLDGPITPTCNPASGSTFPVGQTTVTCSATDAHGNTGTDTAKITITLVDTTPPVVTAPADINDTTTVNAGKVENFSATATDNLDGTLTPTCNHASGSTFPIGQTTVTCSATDAHGNIGTASFKITITLVDTTPPVVHAPADISQTTTVSTGKVVTFSATATDNLDGAITPTCSPASGSTFPVGQTTVTCSATDAHGNTGTDTAKITITLVDTTPPVVHAPADINETTTINAGKVVTFSATATDNLDGTLTPTCSPASGSIFPIGQTTVTCSATDAHGNTGTDTAKITITLVDTTPPVVTAPADIVREAASADGATVTFSASATDNLDGTITPTCTPASGSTFPIGQTTVTCSATDAHHNTGTDTFKITVQDTTAPVVTPPLMKPIEASGPHTVVTFAASATDNIDGPIPLVTCAPASGSLFVLGTTPVTCTAGDSHGNTGTVTFDVVVQDKTPPRLNVPGKITLSSPDGGPLPRTQTSITGFLAAPQANDLVDGAVPVTNDAPASFPLGTTTVTFAAHDAAGNKVSATSAITVVFTPAAPPLAPPTFDTSPPADPTSVTAKPGNRKVVLSWQAPSAPDLDHYVVEQSTPESQPAPVYTGAATTFTAASLTNGVQYRFVVVSVDHSGNQSTGAVVTAMPVEPMLLKPADGAVIATLPVLVWKGVPSAAYYNVQLYRMPSLAAVGGRKILSAWPVTNSMRLARTWRFTGVSYQLSPGVYRWFVWPGLGERAGGKYGPLLGSSAFVIRRTLAPVTKPKPKPKPKPKKKP